MNYDWNFNRVAQYGQAFLAGTQTTVLLTIATIVLGTLLGLALGLAMQRRTARLVILPIVEIIRAVPPLVILLFTYYLLSPQTIGMTFQAFWICVIALSANLAAFTAELVHAALRAVPATAIDAGRALGMTERQLLSHVIFPHMARQLVPAMTMLYISMLKLTSLASVINVREVVFAAQTVIATTTRSLESWTIVAVIYIVLVLPSTYLARRLEKRMVTGPERETGLLST